MYKDINNLSERLYLPTARVYKTKQIIAIDAGSNAKEDAVREVTWLLNVEKG